MNDAGLVGQAVSGDSGLVFDGGEPVLEPVAGAVDGNDVAVMQQPVQDPRKIRDLAAPSFVERGSPNPRTGPRDGTGRR